MKTSIIFPDEQFSEFVNKLQEIEYSSLFILVDKNTSKYCLPKLLKHIPHINKKNIFCLPNGENHKNINTCQAIWEQMLTNALDRKSLLINLGGGVVSDIGAFVASTFKRGIRFVNIPTTLLAMVDAAIGGKTGVNLKKSKNQIGSFAKPELVVIFPDFLKTLGNREFNSGFAEIVKYALVADKKLWNKLLNENISNKNKIATETIKRCIAIKTSIVKKDPYEINIRKKLNFGHTIGHAIESCFMTTEKKNILHGEAVGLGLIIECIISDKIFGLKELEKIKVFLKQYYSSKDLKELDIDILLNTMTFDKKNVNGKINFTLLKEIGNSTIDNYVNTNLIKESILEITRE
ncbi:MAG: 3-dehydroquinate synthase [Bacteroidota bacterium]|nr:3-dehydroquinate synthase [Bacteroidota bacterium]